MLDLSNKMYIYVKVVGWCLKFRRQNFLKGGKSCVTPNFWMFGVY